MIICAKDNCLASGTVTKKGGEMKYIGERNIPKYCFSICIKNEKCEDGEWRAEYLDCELFGKKSENAPLLTGGEMVLCAGKRSTRRWKGREGEDRTSTILDCDFVMVAPKGPQNVAQKPSANPQGFQEMDDEEADGDLPF